MMELFAWGLMFGAGFAVSCAAVAGVGYAVIKITRGSK